MDSKDSEAGKITNDGGAGKETVTLRLDPSVVERLQQSGEDWEQRVSDLLRAALDGGKINN
jgi:uncharacterized protein (DUF4415 family)